MTQLYLIDIDDNISLVFTEKEIINNMYTDTGDAYEAFEHTLYTTAKAAGATVKSLTKLESSSQLYVKRMFENSNVFSEKDIIDYILQGVDLSS